MHLQRFGGFFFFFTRLCGKSCAIRLTVTDNEPKDFKRQLDMLWEIKG